MNWIQVAHNLSNSMKTEFAQNQTIVLFIICIVTGNAQQQHEPPSFKLWVKNEGASGDGVGDGPNMVTI